MKRFHTNYDCDTELVTMLTGDNQTVPGQTNSITDIVYRFQGGIIPDANSIFFDPIEADEDYLDIRNMSGFDITDAFHANQQGKKEYAQYVKERNEQARAALKQKAKEEFEAQIINN